MLADDDVRINLDSKLKMNTIVVGPIEVRFLSLDIGNQVIAKAQIDAETARKVLLSGTFHVDDINNLPGWDDQNPIEIVLRLRKPFLKLFQNADELFRNMFTKKDSPLRQTEAWLLHEAMQHTEVPGVPDATTSFGIRTDWAEPL